MGLLVGEAALRRSVPLDMAALEAVEEGFRALGTGKVTTPDVLRVDVPERHGEVDVKTAVVHGVESFAIKVSSGFFDNASMGLPTSSGLMMLISAETGMVLGLLLDNGYLTTVRTAAAGAVAAKYLAPRRVARVGVIGSGTQALQQVKALRLVRSFSQVTVWSRRRAHAQRLADTLREEGVSAEVASHPRALVEQSDVVITATPSTEPIVEAAWLHPGMHITAMGSDAPGKQELFPGVLEAADLLVCDLKRQCQIMGECQHAGGAVDMNRTVELGEVVAGHRPGRVRDDHITVCDLTGTGVQDTMIARMAYQRAEKQGIGTAFS